MVLPKSRYDITSVVNPLFSFYQTIVPREHTQLVKFINAIILNFPYLSGLARRYAAAISSKVDYSRLSSKFGDKGLTDVVLERLKDTVDNSGYYKMQMEVFTNLFFYPKLVVTIGRQFDYHVTCKHCGKDHNISKITGTYFEVMLTTEGSGKKVKLKAQFDCLYCNAKNNGVPLKWKMRAGTVDKPPFYFHVWNPYYTRVSRGVTRTRSQFIIDMDRFRECYPDRYCSGAAFTFSDLDGTDPEFIKAALAYKEYMPNPNYSHLFVNEPAYAGIETEISVALLNVAALMHNGVLRRGQEADAIIKATPNILITPAMGENSKANTTLDGKLVNDVVMQLVQGVQSGDTLGLGYIPIPMTANRLYAEPRRTLLEKEIREEEMNVLMTTGIDASVFQGGTGVSDNPFVLSVMQELFSLSSSQMDDMSEIYVKMIKDTLDSVKLPNGMKRLYQLRIDEHPGTYLDKEYKDYASSGLVPMGPIMRHKGFNSVEDAVKQRLEEERNIANIRREYEVKMNADSQASAIKDNASGQISAEMLGRVEEQLTAQAEEIAAGMEKMYDGQKKSELDRLSKNNRLLYGMVKIKLDELNNIRTQEAKQMMREGGQQDGGE